MNHRFALLIFSACLAAAAQTSAGANGDTYSVQWENDRIANTDRHYTNGFRIGWVSDAEDGSDFPLIHPDKWIAAAQEVGFKPEVMPGIMKDNAARLLGLA